MPCATTYVIATLMGHNKNKGASIQSSISPNSERRREVGAAGRAVVMGSVFLSKSVAKVLPKNA
jgi:hypothetical protein